MSMSLMSFRNKPTLERRLRQTIDWLKTLAPNTKLTLNGKPLTPPRVIQAFKSVLITLNEVDAAHANYRTTLDRWHQVQIASRPLFFSVQDLARAMYGKSSPMLAQAGFRSSGRQRQSVETKAQALERSRATRQARHTMGARQRDLVKGIPEATIHSSPAAVPTTNGMHNGAANAAVLPS